VFPIDSVGFENDNPELIGNRATVSLVSSGSLLGKIPSTAKK
jgi:hypothetical protein